MAVSEDDLSIPGALGADPDERPVPPHGHQARTARPPIFRGNPYIRIGLVLGLMTLWRQTMTSGLVGPDLFNRWLFLAIIVVGFYFVFGVSGQFAFSQAAFAGLGAYVAAWQSRDGHSFLRGLVVGVVIAMIVSAVFSLVVRRAAHFYFAIGTLGISEIIILFLKTNKTLQGPNGGEISNVPPPKFLGLEFSDPIFNRAGEQIGVVANNDKIFWLLMVTLAICFVAGTWLERSPVVREAIAVRDHEVVSSTLGLPVLRIRVMMFVLGSAVAAGAGVLLVHWKSSATHEQFGVSLGLGIFLMLILGGVGSMYGAILGAWFYVYVEHWMRDLDVEVFGNPLGQFWPLVYGTTLVVVMVLLPDGLIGGWKRLRKVAGKRGRALATPTWLQTVLGLAQPVVPVPPADAAPAGGVGAAAAEAGVAARPGAERPPVTDEVVLQGDNVSVSFGGVRAVDQVSLQVHRGEILGLIGPNGSGKSTFLNAVTGVVPATGTLRVFGQAMPLGRPARMRRAGVLRTYQTPQTFLHLTCIENVLLTVPKRARTGIAAAWVLRPLVLKDEHERWEVAARALDRFGLLHRAEESAANLSYGQQRMLELARTVAASPQVILLDEPSAGLNAAETDILAAHLESLRDEGMSLLLVDHKIDFVSRLSDRVAVLELGKKVAEGDPVGIWSDPRVVDAYLGVTETEEA